MAINIFFLLNLFGLFLCHCKPTAHNRWILLKNERRVEDVVLFVNEFVIYYIVRLALLPWPNRPLILACDFSGASHASDATAYWSVSLSEAALVDAEGVVVWRTVGVLLTLVEVYDQRLSIIVILMEALVIGFQDERRIKEDIRLFRKVGGYSHFTWLMITYEYFWLLTAQLLLLKSLVFTIPDKPKHQTRDLEAKRNDISEYIKQWRVKHTITSDPLVKIGGDVPP